MKRFGTTTRIAFAMTMWTATVLLLLRMTGILNDGSEQTLSSRTQLCETLAVSCTQFASTGNDDAIQIALESLVRRNKEVLAAACRMADGTLANVVGDHEKFWQTDDSRSTTNCIQVPILAGDQLWGRVEVCFVAPVVAGIFGFFTLPSIKITLIAALANMLGFSYLMRRCFQYLDPSKAVPDRVRTALDTLAEGVLVLDDHNRIMLANRTFAEMLGREADSFQGQSIELLPWKIENVHSFSDFLLQLVESSPHGNIETSHVQLSVPGGKTRILKPNASSVANEEGKRCGILLSLDDITSLEEKNQQLHFLATRDPMTLCMNRRSFFEKLEETWKTTQRYKHPLCCVMVDVDHFKSVNDNHGHAMGDEVLKQVAAVLRQTARDTDCVCRYGGEEFCILLPHVDISGAVLACERYRKAIEKLEFENLRVTASLGCSSFEFNPSSIEQMLEQADQALYHAKRNGRNRVVRFDEIPARTATVADETKGILNQVVEMAREIHVAASSKESQDISTLK